MNWELCWNMGKLHDASLVELLVVSKLKVSRLEM
jgi:hypothetical protein